MQALDRVEDNGKEGKKRKRTRATSLTSPRYCIRFGFTGNSSFGRNNTERHVAETVCCWLVIHFLFPPKIHVSRMQGKSRVKEKGKSGKNAYSSQFRCSKARVVESPHTIEKKSFKPARNVCLLVVGHARPTRTFFILGFVLAYVESVSRSKYWKIRKTIVTPHSAGYRRWIIFITWQSIVISLIVIFGLSFSRTKETIFGEQARTTTHLQMPRQKEIAPMKWHAHTASRAP